MKTFEEIQDVKIKPFEDIPFDRGPDFLRRQQHYDNIIDMATEAPLAKDWQIADPDNIAEKGNDFERGFWGGVAEAAKRGSQQALADVALTMAVQRGNEKEIERAMKIKERLLNNETLNPLEGHWLSTFLYANARTAGQVFQALKAGGMGAVVVGGIGAVGGALVGGIVPTVGEEPLTIGAGAAAGLKAGARLGVAEGAAIFSYRQGFGEMYYEMLKDGADPEVIQTVAGVAAIPYALIEIAQLKQLTPQIKKALSKKLQTSVMKVVLEFSKRYGTTYGREVAEEMLQKVTTIVANDTAQVLSGNDIEISRDMIRERIWEVYEEGKGAAKSMALLPLPGAAIEVGTQVVASRKQDLMPAEAKEAAPAKPELAPAKPVEPEVAPEAKPETAIPPQTPEDAARALAIFQEYRRTGDEAILEDLPPGVKIKITPEEVDLSLARTLDTAEKRTAFKERAYEAMGAVELREANFADLRNSLLAYQQVWGEIDPLPQPVLRYIGFAERVEKAVGPRVKAEERITQIEKRLLEVEEKGRDLREILVEPNEAQKNLVAERQRLTEGGGLAWHTAMRTAMKNVEELRPTVEVEQHEGRTRQLGKLFTRIKQLKKKGIPAEERIKQAKAVMAGPLTEYQRFESLDKYVSPEFLERAHEDIETTERLTGFEKVRADEAFRKMREGYMLTEGEIALLKKWLPQLSDVLSKWEKTVSPFAKIMAKVESVLGLFKLSAAWDVQMRRQARWFRARHPKLYAQAVEKNLEAYISQKRADKMAREVETHKKIKQAKKYGLQFLKRKPKAGERTEQYLTHLGHRIPIYGRFYTASMRGFVDAYNWLTMQLWDYHTEKWSDQGRQTTHRDFEQLAEFINTFLGMYPAQTGFGKALRRVLAPVMWSPTLTWSRVRSPEMILTNKAMRGETAWTLGSYIGSGVMMMGAATMLAYLVGHHFKKKKDKELRDFANGVVEWDPRSTDFGKIRVGDTRIDIYGDGGPYIRALMQTMTQQKKNQAGRIRRGIGLESAKQLLRNKRAPFIDICMMVWNKRNYYGGPAYALPDWAEIKEEGGIKQIVAKVGEKITEPKVGEIGYFVTRDLVARPFVPFFVQGTVEASWEDGWPMGVWAGAEEFFSGSTLSYKPSNHSKAQLLQDQAAVSKYDKLWEDLSPTQQKALRREVPEINEFEEKATFERLPSKEIKLQEQIESSEFITGGLSDNIREELNQAHVRVPGLSRKMGEFWLNDRRYKAYQERSLEEVKKRLQKVTGTERWKKIKDDKKASLLRSNINAAKKTARAKLRRDIERGEI